MSDRARNHMDCYSGGEECLSNQADCPMKPCPHCGGHGMHRQDEWNICLVEETVINEEPEDDKSVYMGLQIIVDITGRDQEEIWKALEQVLCGACDTGERDCTIESMASCTLTDDIKGIFAWMNNEEPPVVLDKDQMVNATADILDTKWGVTDDNVGAVMDVVESLWEAGYEVVRRTEEPDVQQSQTDATPEETPTK